MTETTQPVRTIRTGSVTDVDTVVGLMDRAVEWLVAQGRTGQWGDQPWSASEARVARLRGMIEAGELLLLDQDGVAIAALVHGPTAHDYVPPSAEPEDFVLLLVSAPSPESRGAGRRLLDESWTRARAAGLGRQRVDCYAGDDGKLVRTYEAAGFTRTEPFEVKGWPGQILERRA